MKAFFLFSLILVTACSGKKRIPFDQKLKDLQLAQAEAQRVPEARLKPGAYRDGFLCQAITREETKDIFLAPMRRTDSDKVSYDFFEVDNQGILKPLGLELGGILFYHFEGKYVQNKDGSVTDSVRGMAVSKRNANGISYRVQFLIEDSQDRGISVFSTLEAKKRRGVVEKSELAQISGCVKTSL